VIADRQAELDPRLAQRVDGRPEVLGRHRPASSS
jgi:hypothetical protein